MAPIKNPAFYAGPPLETMTVRAVDSITWKAGQFGKYNTSGTAALCVSNDVAAHFIFAQDQDTATSSSDVKVYKIASNDQKFVGYIVNGATDTRATQTWVGEKAALKVASNVCSVNIAVDSATTQMIKIEEVMPNLEPQMNPATQVPGRVIFSICQSFIEQVGS